MKLIHLIPLIVATAVCCIAADTTIGSRDEWMHTSLRGIWINKKEDGRITHLIFGEAPGRVRFYDGVSIGKDQSVGHELLGRYEIDFTHKPATLVIYFDDDPHYAKGFSMHMIIELTSPKKLRMEEFKEKSPTPDKFSDKSMTLKKQ